MPRLEEVREFLNDYLGDKFRNAGITAPPDDLRFIEAGILDSFGFVELVAAVEERFGIRVNFDDVDVEVLGTLGGFARTVSSSASS